MYVHHHHRPSAGCCDSPTTYGAATTHAPPAAPAVTLAASTIDSKTNSTPSAPTCGTWSPSTTPGRTQP